MAQTSLASQPYFSRARRKLPRGKLPRFPPRTGRIRLALEVSSDRVFILLFPSCRLASSLAKPPACATQLAAHRTTTRARQQAISTPLHSLAGGRRECGDRTQQREGQCTSVHKFVHCLGTSWATLRNELPQCRFIVAVHFQEEPNACPSSVQTCALTFSLL